MAAPTWNTYANHETIQITVRDGTTPTPTALVLTMENATLQWQQVQGGGILQSVTVLQRRGKNTGALRGERVQIPVSLSGRMVSVDGNELHNFLLKRKTYSTNVSTLGATQKVYTVDLEAKFVGTGAAGADEPIIFTQVHFVLTFAEQENDALTVSYEGTCMGEVLVDGSDPIQTERT